MNHTFQKQKPRPKGNLSFLLWFSYMKRLCEQWSLVLYGNLAQESSMQQASEQAVKTRLSCHRLNLFVDSEKVKFVYLNSQNLQHQMPVRFYLQITEINFWAAFNWLSKVIHKCFSCDKCALWLVQKTCVTLSTNQIQNLFVIWSLSFLRV